MITRRSFLIGVAVVGLGGCGGDDNGDDDGPPAISYGSETCDRCNMVISEERHAAALKGDDEWLAFDDCGEMIAYAQENAMTTWIAGYQSACDDARVYYNSIGSGGGRSQFIDGAVAKSHVDFVKRLLRLK